MGLITTQTPVMLLFDDNMLNAIAQDDIDQLISGIIALGRNPV